MNADAKSWRLMKRYNCQDVRAMKPLYERMRPWIVKHPSAVLDGAVKCRVCESENLQKRGTTSTRQSTFQQYRCNDCGAWMRETHRLSGASLVEAVA